MRRVLGLFCSLLLGVGISSSKASKFFRSVSLKASIFLPLFSSGGVGWTKRPLISREEFDCSQFVFAECDLLYSFCLVAYLPLSSTSARGDLMYRLRFRMRLRNIRYVVMFMIVFTRESTESSVSLSAMSVTRTSGTRSILGLMR